MVFGGGLHYLAVSGYDIVQHRRLEIYKQRGSGFMPVRKCAHSLFSAEPVNVKHAVVFVGVIEQETGRDRFPVVIPTRESLETDDFFCVQGIYRLKIHIDVLIFNDLADYFGSDIHNLLLLKIMERVDSRIRHTNKKKHTRQNGGMCAPPRETSQSSVLPVFPQALS